MAYHTRRNGMLHTVNFTCPVSQSTVNALIGNCLGAINQKASGLMVNISSSGGDLVAGFTAYHFLKSLPVPVYTHNLSNVESVANVIFLAGKKRTANPGSRFLLHPFHWGFSTPAADHLRIAEWTACLDNDLERFVDILEVETDGGKSRDDWKKIIAAATIVNPTSATEWGLIAETKAAAIPLEPGTYWWINC